MPEGGRRGRGLRTRCMHNPRLGRLRVAAAVFGGAAIRGGHPIDRVVVVGPPVTCFRLVRVSFLSTSFWTFVVCFFKSYLLL